MKLYVWIIPDKYQGFSIGYTREVYLWTIAESLGEARRMVVEKITESTYPLVFKDNIFKVLEKESPKVYKDGEVGMF